MTQEEEVMSLKDAAKFLGVSSDTLAKYLKSEEIPCRKLGKKWRFSKKALVLVGR